MKRIDKYRTTIEKKDKMNVDVTIYASDRIVVDEKAVNQITDAASLPSVYKVIGTPDIHAGYGVPIGCVLAAKDIVSPSAVGYDINCGMRLISTPFKFGDIDAKALSNEIARDVPLGEGKRNISVSKDLFKKIVRTGFNAYTELVQKDDRLSEYFYEKEFLDDKHKTEDNGSLPGIYEALPSKSVERGINQFGTLGGGNHFIEIQEVTDVFNEKTASHFGLFKGQITIMLHSGSRGFGHEIAGDFMKLATGICKKQGLRLPSSELSYLDSNSDEGKNYIGAMNCAANFAYMNRLIMINLIRRIIRRRFGNDIKLPSVYDVAHNMVKYEKHDGNMLWVHRKGATRAFSADLMKNTIYHETGQPVIIPGSMGTHSYVLSGCESGKEALYSVCHGAGRVMSRTQASGKNRKGKSISNGGISDDEFKKSMKDIHLVCENRRTIKEEAPQAYKDIESVIDIVCSCNLATRVARMRPLAVLKG